ncbi:MAG: hypothetical protein K9G58_05135 [Bacteroidales bacterium]|nr:hypothetical protein [Bacteroidales bacterium]MCF8386277.1 hypothetical protein [Bacteroidales bacterium]MCF8397530.1 hypothetical protein [Bacteroidales bacterium]
MIPQKSSTQLIFASDDWNECYSSIKEKWNQGYVISCADFGRDQYCIVMNKGTDWGEQNILISNDFPYFDINDYWDRRLDITHIFRDKNKWYLVFTGDTPASGQEWQYKQSFGDIKRFIRTLWGQRKFISACYQHENNYFMLMSGGPECKQKWVISQVVPENIMSGNYLKELNWFITCLAEIDGKLMKVFSSATAIQEQFILRSTNMNDLADKLDEYWEKGYFISNCAFVREDLYLVFSKYVVS